MQNKWCGTSGIKSGIFRGLILIPLVLIILACNGGSHERQPNITADKRIISLSPHITEIIYAIGGQENLIAVSDFCKYPARAAEKPQIGGLINPNIEKIVSLKPTALIGVPSHAKLHQELIKFKLPVIMLANENIDDVLQTIDTLGVILDRKNAAIKLIKSIEDSLKYIMAAAARQKPHALLIIGRERGTLKNITAAGDDTFINEIWEIAGGINTFQDLPSRYGTVNLEAVLSRNPEIIIEFEMDSIPGITKNDDQVAWSRLGNVSAIREGNVFTVRGNHTLIPGPRIVLLARQFRHIIEQVALK